MVSRVQTDRCSILLTTAHCGPVGPYTSRSQSHATIRSVPWVRCRR